MCTTCYKMKNPCILFTKSIYMLHMMFLVSAPDGIQNKKDCAGEDRQ
jgi:hypothetical protein